MNGVSIILCTYNGATRLPETFSYLEKIETDFPWELLIVDNNSSDGSAKISYEYLSKAQLDFRVVIENQQGLSFAKWRGIRESQYDLILFCDDDNHLDSQFLKIGFDIFCKNSSCGILGSKGLKKIKVQEPRWFDQFSHSYAVGSLGKNNGPQKTGTYHYGAACFFRKSALEKLLKNGFKSILSGRTGTSLNSGEDVELCYAIQLLGYELWFENRLVFYHFIESHRLSWKYYLRLKMGIANSFPLLESYRISDFHTVEEFKKHLRMQYFFVLKGIIKSGFLSINPQNLESIVAFESSKIKLMAYSRNIKGTVSAFIRNKEIFGA